MPTPRHTCSSESTPASLTLSTLLVSVHLLNVDLPYLEHPCSHVTLLPSLSMFSVGGGVGGSGNLLYHLVVFLILILPIHIISIASPQGYELLHL